MTKPKRFPLDRCLRLAEKTVILIGFPILLIMIASLVVSTFTALVADKYLFDEFCLERACLDRAIEGFDIPLKVAEVTVAYLVGLATATGLIVALRVYLTNSAMLRQQTRSSRMQAAALEEQVKSAALQLHSVRFSAFREYILGEVSKFDRLGIDCIDATTWYFRIHPRSIEGDLSIDNAYSTAMSDIAVIVETSDNLIALGKEKFSYKEHQKLMMDVFRRIGIRIESLPRLDYFMVEDEVFALIQSVHRVFGVSSEDFGKRNYRKLY